ncbi:MAG: pilus assembly protein [Planctomycetes bacterium]|nr:pilus assembly protein [Planctomycetota bacterium]
MNRSHRASLRTRRFLTLGQPKRRFGIASVELAFVLPVILTFVLGTIEVCQRIFLRQSAVLAAYEGARLAVRNTSDNARVVARCNALLQQRKILGAAVTITPENLMQVPAGTEITIRIDVPWAQNSPTRFVLRDQGVLTVNATMLRE